MPRSPRRHRLHRQRNFQKYLVGDSLPENEDVEQGEPNPDEGSPSENRDAATAEPEKDADRTHVVAVEKGRLWCEPSRGVPEDAQADQKEPAPSRLEGTREQIRLVKENNVQRDQRNEEGMSPIRGIGRRIVVLEKEEVAEGEEERRGNCGADHRDHGRRRDEPAGFLGRCFCGCVASFGIFVWCFFHGRNSGVKCTNGHPCEDGVRILRYEVSPGRAIIGPAARKSKIFPLIAHNYAVRESCKWTIACIGSSRVLSRGASDNSKFEILPARTWNGV